MSHDGWGEVDSQSFRCHLMMREKRDRKEEGGRGREKGDREEGGEEGGAVMKSLSNYIQSNCHLAILPMRC